MRSPLPLVLALSLLTAAPSCPRAADPPVASVAAAAAPAPPPISSHERRGRFVVVLAGSAGAPADLDRLAADLEAAAEAMAARLPVEITAPISVRVETDYVAQARRVERIDPAVRLSGGETDLSLVCHPDDAFAYRHELAGVLLDRAGLSAKLPPWLAQGAALWLSRDWYGRPYGEWLQALASADILPSAAELLAPAGSGRREAGSVVLWTPVAAAVVERLPGKTLAAKLARLPAAGEIDAILHSLAGSKAPAPRAAGPRPMPRGFWKGISFAMLNRIEGGYHAPSVDARLAVLKRLGVDSISLMPFGFAEQVDRPAIWFSHRHPAGETDAGLVHATRAAHRAGLRVLYKPHLWVGHGAWVGEIAMTSETDWVLWFRGYRSYLLHHAILARFAGADSFSVGVELSKTTGRTADWRRLIAAVRSVYPGPVTYAANWYGEPGAIAFWGDLDAIGIDAYFPLSTSRSAATPELAAGARATVAGLAALGERWHRPVWLTEVGFAAREAAWTEPHIEGGPYSEADQAKAYGALFAALGRPGDRPWLAGAFLWKVFSGDGGEARAGRSDFQFLGREAEGVVRGWYGGTGPAR